MKNVIELVFVCVACGASFFYALHEQTRAHVLQERVTRLEQVCDLELERLTDARVKLDDPHERGVAATEVSQHLVEVSACAPPLMVNTYEYDQALLHDDYVYIRAMYTQLIAAMTPQER